VVTDITVRPENRDDTASIEKIISSTFRDHPQSNQKEHFLVADLRNQGALTLSLVAVLSYKVVGHIAFSEVTINGKRQSWYGLAPVAVAPDDQKRGIGTKLITEGLAAIKKNGARGCVLLGEPEYYNRFGFTANAALTLPDVPPEFFLALSFCRNIPSGVVAYHKAFAANG